MAHNSCKPTIQKRRWPRSAFSKLTSPRRISFLHLTISRPVGRLRLHFQKPFRWKCLRSVAPWSSSSSDRGGQHDVDVSGKLLEARYAKTYPNIKSKFKEICSQTWMALRDENVDLASDHQWLNYAADTFLPTGLWIPAFKRVIIGPQIMEKAREDNIVLFSTWCSHCEIGFLRPEDLSKDQTISSEWFQRCQTYHSLSTGKEEDRAGNTRVCITISEGQLGRPCASSRFISWSDWTVIVE